MTRDKTFCKVPNWAQYALLKSMGNPFLRNGIAGAQADGGVLLIQMVWREQRQKAVVVQRPFRDVQEAYDSAAGDLPPREHICYFVLATAAALSRAEDAGVCYMRCWSIGDDTAGAILRVPVSLWTETADA
ncbi:hypothetical protein OG866_06975 [Streptomyces sp. NBC_00663]|uniref:hypothetical protein n=1 Tax=Streptomyces sp. NBC_00663 TaxID=2975801 RepID=UPI002E36FC6B|nr:hypothetical protein [Streptomyces sp. NBC_00663]